MPPTRQALLVMDMENGITQYFPETTIQPFADAISTARASGVPVIFVTVGWRASAAEVSERNRYIAPLAASGVFVDGSPATEVDPRLAPREGEVVVVKRRVGAFTGGDLELVLRAGGITSLVLTGIGTSGVVLSTLVAGTEQDYDLTVLSDCCADQDAEVQRVLVERVFPAHARVITSKEWAETLAG